MTWGVLSDWVTQLHYFLSVAEEPVFTSAAAWFVRPLKHSDRSALCRACDPESLQVKTIGEKSHVLVLVISGITSH